jgi:hypothetical protein
MRLRNGSIMKLDQKSKSQSQTKEKVNTSFRPPVGMKAQIFAPPVPLHPILFLFNFEGPKGSN